MTKARRVWIAAVIAVLGALALLATWKLTRPRVEQAEAPATEQATRAPATWQPPLPTPTERAPEPAVSARPHRLAPAVSREDRDAELGAFSGRVINWGNGRGVPDAEVVLARGEAATSIRTDADGRFSFAPSELGSWRIAVVTADGFLPYAPEWGDSPIALRARRHMRVDGVVIYLTPEIAYTGLVIDDAGKPVAAASVRIMDDSGDSALTPRRDRFTTDARGEFSFSAPDWAVIEATHPGKGRGRAVVDGAVQTSHRMKIAVSPKTAVADGSIAGIAVDERGEPVGDARVVATPKDEWRRDARAGGRAVTAADGRFEIANLEDGHYNVIASRDDKAEARALVEVGERTLRLELRPGARVRGKVTAGGRPVAAFSVVAGVKRGLLETVRGHGSVFDPDGEFELGGLDPGETWIRVTAPGFAKSDAVIAVASANPRSVDVKLGRGGTLVGTVIDAGDRRALPLAKVALEMQIGEGPSALPYASVVVTDDDGSFELSGLPPGRVSVVASAYQHHSQIIGGLEVAEGVRLGPMTIELTPVAEGEEPKIELAGLGLALSARDEGLVVNEVFEGGGGQEAGIAVGDIILAVDGKQTAELGFQESLQAIRGPVGTAVRLTVQSKAGGVRDVTAMRRKIRA